MIEEKVVVGEGTRYSLNGLLTLPEGACGPVPAVVLVHGSGSSNMDEKVGALTPFRDLAHGLAARGIASLRYDKRSFAHGLKMMRDKSGPITVKEETVDDALLATRLLRRDSRVDAERVFLIGHSMGAMLAPRIDGAGGDYRGLVLMAGTPRGLEEVIIGQNERAAAEMKGLARRLVEKQTEKLRGLFAGLYELSDEQARSQKMGGGTTLYYFKEMGRPSVADHLAVCRKPMLVLQGEKDFQVLPEVDFARYRQLLGERENVTFKLYPGLNHAFVPAQYDTISMAKKEYRAPRPVSEEVVEDIARWILSVDA